MSERSKLAEHCLYGQKSKALTLMPGNYAKPAFFINKRIFIRLTRLQKRVNRG